MKPIIGVMPLWDEEKDSIWMLPGYMDALCEAGGVPVMFPFSTDEEALEQLVGMCDGFLFTGGQDVSPELYGGASADATVEVCARRDALEGIVLRQALAADKPVLGICRGLQFINAALGGTLYRDLPTEHPSDVVHRQRPPYDAPVHEVSVARSSPLYECLGKERLAVNSCHHQAVRDAAPGMQVMALSPDGLVEALYMPGRRFLWGVQWHPEFLFRTDGDSRAVFRAFTEAARRAR